MLIEKYQFFVKKGRFYRHAHDFGQLAEKRSLTRTRGGLLCHFFRSYTVSRTVRIEGVILFVSCKIKAVKFYLTYINVFSAVAEYVKFYLMFCHLQKFDERFGRVWYCIVGEQFGSCVEHRPDEYIEICLPETCLLYTSPSPRD